MSRVLPSLRKKVVTITSLKWEAQNYFLSPCPRVPQIHSRGVAGGFRVGLNYNGLKGFKKSTSNVVSTMQKPEVVREYLSKECAESQLLDSLLTRTVPKCTNQQDWVIPKGSTGKWCFIVDLSVPEDF